MAKFVQIGSNALNVDCITEVLGFRDNNGKEAVMIFVTYATTPLEPRWTLYGDEAQRFLVWWGNSADVYRC